MIRPAPAEESAELPPEEAQAALERADKRVQTALDALRTLRIDEGLPPGVPPSTREVDLWLDEILPSLREVARELRNGRGRVTAALKNFRKTVDRAVPSFRRRAEELDAKGADFTDPAIAEIYAQMAEQMRRWADGYRDRVKRYNGFEQTVERELRFVRESEVMLDDYEGVLQLIPEDADDASVERYLDALKKYRERVEEFLEDIQGFRPSPGAEPAGDSLAGHVRGRLRVASIRDVGDLPVVLTVSVGGGRAPAAVRQHLFERATRLVGAHVGRPLRLYEDVFARVANEGEAWERLIALSDLSRFVARNVAALRDRAEGRPEPTESVLVAGR